MKSDPHITLTTLEKSRGWTKKMINEYLGEPDKLVPNPYYRSSPPMKLYQLSRVIEVESQDWFKSLLESKQKSREKRQAAALLVAQRKREELLDHINKLKVKIVYIKTLKKLYAYGCKHYNQLQEYRGKYSYASTSDDVDFLNRITVNALRHSSSCYDEELDSLFGKVGKEMGYIHLKNKTLDEIAKMYPFLKEECDRQRVNSHN